MKRSWDVGCDVCRTRHESSYSLSRLSCRVQLHMNEYNLLYRARRITNLGAHLGKDVKDTKRKKKNRVNLAEVVLNNENSKPSLIVTLLRCSRWKRFIFLFSS